MLVVVGGLVVVELVGSVVLVWSFCVLVLVWSFVSVGSVCCWWSVVAVWSCELGVVLWSCELLLLVGVVVTLWFAVAVGLLGAVVALLIFLCVGWFVRQKQGDVVMDWLADFDRAYGSYERMIDSAPLGVVREFLTPNVGGNFQEGVYGSFWVNGPLYFSFKDALVEFAELSDDEFIARLWERMVGSVGRLLSAKGGGVRRSLDSLFVEGLEVWCGEVFSVRGRENALRLFRAYLANSLWGVIGERRAFELLVGEFGSDVVRLAGDDVECDDVDLLVNGFPVSVKSLNAFHERSFGRYRFGAGKSVPVAYVSDRGDVVLPVGSGFRGSDLAGLARVCGLSSLGVGGGGWSDAAAPLGGGEDF